MYLGLGEFMKNMRLDQTFSSADLVAICDKLGLIDPDLKSIIEEFGYPPFWSRPNSFDSLVHIILEQQVSLASALSAINQLRNYIGEVTPEKLLTLTDTELKACYFSRQKTTYTRALAEAIVSKKLIMSELENCDNQAIHKQLVQIKGVGDWTIDVYLVFVLQRLDIFPIGDLAARNALKQLKSLPTDTSHRSLLELAESWKPYRSVATMLLWHYYLSLRKK